GPDLLEGSRVRNELGARVRYVHRERGRWRVRGQVDAWTLPADGAVAGSAGTVSLRGSGRADWLAWPLFQPSLQVELSGAGRFGGEAPCSEGDSAATGEDGACVSVGRYRVTARVKSDVGGALSVAAQYSHARVDAPEEDGPRVDG